jgi:hypothetical protein
MARLPLQFCRIMTIRVDRQAALCSTDQGQVSQAIATGFAQRYSPTG